MTYQTIKLIEEWTRARGPI